MLKICAVRFLQMGMGCWWSVHVNGKLKKKKRNSYKTYAQNSTTLIFPEKKFIFYVVVVVYHRRFCISFIHQFEPVKELALLVSFLTVGTWCFLFLVLFFPTNPMYVFHFVFRFKFVLRSHIGKYLPTESKRERERNKKRPTTTEERNTTCCML